VPKNETVKTLNSMFGMCLVRDHDAIIHASLLFHRLVIAAYGNRSLKLSHVYEYELTVYPTSLFKSGLM